MLSLRPRRTRTRARLAALAPPKPKPPAPPTRLHRLSPLRSPRTALAAVAVLALLALWWQGPVAALLAAAYGFAGLRELRHAARSRTVAAARERTRQAVSLLAADLRAGTPAYPAVPDTLRALPTVDDPLCAAARRRLSAAWRVADTSGAGCARLLDRLDADLRAGLRSAARTAVHVSGSRATTALLAVLPVAGLLLGSTLGGDVLGVLFHTPLGAACTAAAATLQLTGLAWARRVTTPTEVPT